MIEVYTTLIINHRRTFSQVPESLKDAVEKRLNEQGYDKDGNPLLKEED